MEVYKALRTAGNGGQILSTPERAGAVKVIQALTWHEAFLIF